MAHPGLSTWRAGKPGIFRIAYTDPAAAVTTAAARRMVLLNADMSSYASQIKQANPNALVLVYKCLSSARSNAYAYNSSTGQDIPPLPTGVGYGEANSQHPEWFLTDGSGNRLEWSGYPGAWQMDIGSGTYQARWRDNVISDLNTYTVWDGVFADNANWQAATYTTPPSQYPNDVAMQAAMRSMLAVVGPAIRNANKLFIPNIGAARLWPGLWSDWIQFTDGAMEEQFVNSAGTIGGQRVWDWGSDGWLALVGEVQACAQQGKMCLARVGGADNDTAAWQYGVASYLLVNDGRQVLAPPKFEDQRVYPEYDWDLGSPSGAYTGLGNSVFRRNFSHGVVVVNASQSTPATVQLGGTYRDINGNQVTQITLQGTEGATMRALSDPPPPGTGGIYSIDWDSLTVSPGTHTITARAYDQSGNTSESSIQVNVSNTTTYTILNTTQGTQNNQIEYVGSGWVVAEGESVCDTVDAYALVRFTGTRIDYYSWAWNDHGIIAISVDGGTESMVDTYSPDFGSGGLLEYTSPTLTYGTHTLRLRVTGNKNTAAVSHRLSIVKFVVTTQQPGGGTDLLPPRETSWIANSEHGGGYNDPNARWVQQDAEGAIVESDGTVIAVTAWDEATSEIGVYKDGAVLPRFGDTHGWGWMGGSAVATDSTRCYQAAWSEGVGYGVRVHDRAARWPIVLPSGAGHGESMRTVGANPVVGVACSDTEVFAASNGVVYVYSKPDLTYVREFNVVSVGKIAYRSGSLACISGNSIRVVSASNGSQSSQFSVSSPTAIAWDNSGRVMTFSDTAASQQVLVYTTGGALQASYGTAGGIYSGTPGQVGNLKFNGATGVGVDSTNKIFVINGLGGAGTDIRRFTSDGATMEWRLLCLAFVDNACLDPQNQSIVYTAKDKFSIDLTGVPGQQWTWLSHTLDRFTYPSDERINQDNMRHLSPVVVYLSSTRFLFMTGMYQDSPRFYRFSGEILVPSTQMFNGFNGWGWHVDASGDVWNVEEGGPVWRYDYQSLDGSGNPTYSARVQSSTKPNEFTALQRVHYDSVNDVMYLGGWTNDYPRPAGNDLEKLVGREVIRYNNWSSGNRTPAWRCVLPFSREGTDIRTLYGQIGLSVAGDYFFTVEMATSKVRAYKTADGSFVMEWLPGTEVGSFVGVVDIPDGIRAYRLNTGRYLILVEEDHASKVLMYPCLP